MVEQIRSFEKSESGNTIIFQFNNNRNVTGVMVTLKDVFSELKDSEITVKYALNGITTDLILLGKSNRLLWHNPYS